MVEMRQKKNRSTTLAIVMIALLHANAPGGQPAPIAEPRAAYVLGPGDVLAIRSIDAEEISDKPVPIGANGYITLPLIGRVLAGGLTIEQLEVDLVTRLKRFIRSPEVAISVVEERSQPVSIIGAVNAPGVRQVQGHKSLVEMLSLAGGVRQDAGNTVKITRNLQRGAIPLAGATSDETGRFSVAEVNLKGILEGRTPGHNIPIMPDDVISVPRAELIYVIGEVRRSGGFALNARENISVLQALALAEGLSHTAAPGQARILRLTPAAPRRVEIHLDLSKILAGKENDMPLEPDDILFVPGSRSKNIALRSLESLVQIGTGVAIYRR
jgi:polysaccharide export outer membrane protein